MTKGETKSTYEERIRKGDGKAAYKLALKYRDGDALIKIPKNEVKSLELLHHAADDLGYSTAMMEVERVYATGQHGATRDVDKGRKYSEVAVKLGNVHARLPLGMLEAEEGNIDLAIRHWKVAASAGDERSVKKLWAFFYRKALEKAELEVTLRAHKEACDVVNNEERALVIRESKGGREWCFARTTFGKLLFGRNQRKTIEGGNESASSAKIISQKRVMYRIISKSSSRNLLEAQNWVL